LSVLLDLQGVQSPDHGKRGIGRYLLELTTALERYQPGRVTAYLLSPDLPVPAIIDPLISRGRVVRGEAVLVRPRQVLHIASPFEATPIESLWPGWAHATGMRFAVTLYDVIPALYPEIYLTDERVRRWYGVRIELVRRADRVLAISETTARDAVEQLGLDPAKVTVVGAGVSEQFRQPLDSENAFELARASVPVLEPGFVLYTGGIEPRKNLDRLLSAYADLPGSLRAQHQLVIVCRVLPAERKSLERRLTELGISTRVHFPGYVADDVLVRLYQACTLFVFPSLYEGFGLPVAEALACGAPVIGARTPAVQELVTDDSALFDPLDGQAMREVMQRFLSDPSLREQLTSGKLDPRFTWPGVAERTAAAYEDLQRLPPRPRPSAISDRVRVPASSAALRRRENETPPNPGAPRPP
jgi:glycosyltransferase involved in cell wall biosynthesis